MEDSPKYLIAGITSLLSIFAPVQALICCALVFVGIDFVTGIWAGYKRAQRQHEQWGFESQRAWRTLYKLFFVMGGIILAWLIDHYILVFIRLNLANLFTGFVCGVEFWSYLENAADISQHPIFRRLKRYMRQRIESEIKINKTMEEPTL